MNNNEQNYAEISVCPQTLQNMPESSSAYYISDEVGTVSREEVVSEMIGLVWALADRCLTARQKVVFHLFYHCRRSQEEIAGMLDISQATVNHHLIGKMKRGRPVGGAIQKIRKGIRKAEAKDAGKDMRHHQLIAVLKNMVDQPMTRRNMASHLQNLQRSVSISGIVIR